MKNANERLQKLEAKIIPMVCPECREWPAVLLLRLADECEFPANCPRCGRPGPCVVRFETLAAREEMDSWL
jgi:hypothetical protein